MSAAQEKPTDRLKLRHFALLKALETASNLKEAASALNMHPSAATGLLAELEALFDARLFQRQGNMLSPTAEGLAAIRAASLILSDLENARDDLHALSQGGGAKMRIGISPLAAPILLPNILTQLFAAYPNASVAIDTGIDDQLVPRLLDGELDCVIVRLLIAEVDPRLRCETLYADTADVVVGSHHPLAARESLPAEALQDHNEWITPSKNENYVALTRKLMGDGGPPANIVLQTTSVDVIVHMLQFTRWIGIIPTSVARQYTQHGAIVTLPLPNDADQYPVMLLSRKDDAPDSASYQLLLTLLRDFSAAWVTNGIPG